MKLKQFLLGLAVGLVVLATIAFVPSLTDFNTSQFATSGNKVAIPVSAKVTNLFRIFGNKGGAGTLTNIEPVWIDSGGWFALEGTGPAWTNHNILTMAIKPGGVEGNGFYWGDADRTDFQSWRARDGVGGNLDPRMTHVFGTSDNYTHRIRTNLLEYLEQDNDGNLLMAGAVYTFNRANSQMVLGSNSISTALKGTFISIPTNVFIGGGLTLSNLTATRIAQFDGKSTVTNAPAGSTGQALFQTATGFGWSNVTASSSAGPMTSTNFVLNTVYSNANANPILVRASAFLITAAVNGGPSLDLMYSQTGGTGYTLLSRVAIATTIAGAFTLPITNDITGVITNLGSYYFTNTSSGAGDSSGIVSGSGQITVFGGVGAAGAAGATGATGATGNGVPSTNAPPYTIAINGGLGSTNIVIDMQALGATNAVRATLTGNVGVMFTNVIDGFQITLVLVQDATGNRSISTNATWGFNTRLGTDITGLTLTTNAGYHDYVKIFGDGTNAVFNGFVRGYAP